MLVTIGWFLFMCVCRPSSWQHLVNISTLAKLIKLAEFQNNIQALFPASCPYGQRRSNQPGVRNRSLNLEPRGHRIWHSDKEETVVSLEVVLSLQHAHTKRDAQTVPECHFLHSWRQLREKQSSIWCCIILLFDPTSLHAAFSPFCCAWLKTRRFLLTLMTL